MMQRNRKEEKTKKEMPGLREPYYSASDGAFGLQQAVKTPVAKDDEVLRGLVNQFDLALARIREHLDDNYIWD